MSGFASLFIDVDTLCSHFSPIGMSSIRAEYGISNQVIVPFVVKRCVEMHWFRKSLYAEICHRMDLLLTRHIHASLQP